MSYEVASKTERHFKKHLSPAEKELWASCTQRIMVVLYRAVIGALILVYGELTVPIYASKFVWRCFLLLLDSIQVREKNHGLLD